MLLTDQDQEWLALPPILPGFGLSLKRYRWQQNMSHVDVHIKLPPKVAASQVLHLLGTREKCAVVRAR